MREKWLFSLLLTGVTYILLDIIILIVNGGKIELEILGFYGFCLGIVLMIVSVPFHKLLFFSGNAANGSQTGTFPNEHLQLKNLQKYEAEQHKNKENKKSNEIKGVLSIYGFLMVIIACFII